MCRRWGAKCDSALPLYFGVRWAVAAVKTQLQQNIRIFWPQRRITALEWQVRNPCGDFGHFILIHIYHHKEKIKSVTISVLQPPAFFPLAWLVTNMVMSGNCQIIGNTIREPRIKHFKRNFTHEKAFFVRLLFYGSLDNDFPEYPHGFFSRI